MIPNVVSLGEIMGRFSPAGTSRIVQVDKMDISYGGAEANYAVSLATLGINASFVSRLPENQLGYAARNALRRFGVNVDDIVWGGNRLGLYFLEHGSSQLPSSVTYDRANSAIAHASPDDFDWDLIFVNKDWFHFTGITPALSDTAANVVLAACKAAHAKKIKISCDLNYRNGLWSKEKAGKVMSELMQYVYLLIANEEDAEDVFGIHPANSDVNRGQLNHDDYADVANQLVDMFGFAKVAITLRTSISASNNNWSGMLYDGKDHHFGIDYDITPIVDRVGGGDSLGAALTYALLNDYDSKSAIDFAITASALKHSLPGDFNHATLSQIQKVLNSGGTGRVQR
ncbi:MAG: sugar kinase [Oscillospiraceae bacterium]|nr:sugar kinase [Oscillospiraceae bacterium]